VYEAGFVRASLRYVPWSITVPYKVFTRAYRAFVARSYGAVTGVRESLQISGARRSTPQRLGLAKSLATRLIALLSRIGRGVPPNLILLAN
jgi:hypothetical protein